MDQLHLRTRVRMTDAERRLCAFSPMGAMPAAPEPAPMPERGPDALPTAPDAAAAAAARARAAAEAGRLDPAAARDLLRTTTGAPATGPGATAPGGPTTGPATGPTTGPAVGPAAGPGAAPNAANTPRERLQTEINAAMAILNDPNADGTAKLVALAALIPALIARAKGMLSGTLDTPAGAAPGGPAAGPNGRPNGRPGWRGNRSGGRGERGGDRGDDRDDDRDDRGSRDRDRDDRDDDEDGDRRGRRGRDRGRDRDRDDREEDDEAGRGDRGRDRLEFDRDDPKAVDDPKDALKKEEEFREEKLKDLEELGAQRSDLNADIQELRAERRGTRGAERRAITREINALRAEVRSIKAAVRDLNTERRLSTRYSRDLQKEYDRRQDLVDKNKPGAPLALVALDGAKITADYPPGTDLSAATAALRGKPGADAIAISGSKLTLTVGYAVWEEPTVKAIMEALKTMPRTVPAAGPSGPEAGPDVPVELADFPTEATVGTEVKGRINKFDTEIVGTFVGDTGSDPFPVEISAVDGDVSFTPDRPGQYTLTAGDKSVTIDVKAADATPPGPEATPEAVPTLTGMPDSANAGETITGTISPEGAMVNVVDSSGNIAIPGLSAGAGGELSFSLDTPGEYTITDVNGNLLQELRIDPAATTPEPAPAPTPVEPAPAPEIPADGAPATGPLPGPVGSPDEPGSGEAPPTTTEPAPAASGTPAETAPTSGPGSTPESRRPALEARMNEWRNKSNDTDAAAVAFNRLPPAARNSRSPEFAAFRAAVQAESAYMDQLDPDFREDPAPGLNMSVDAATDVRQGLCETYEKQLNEIEFKDKVDEFKGRLDGIQQTVRGLPDAANAAANPIEVAKNSVAAAKATLEAQKGILAQMRAELGDAKFAGMVDAEFNARTQDIDMNIVDVGNVLDGKEREVNVREFREGMDAAKARTEAAKPGPDRAAFKAAIVAERQFLTDASRAAMRNDPEFKTTVDQRLAELESYERTEKVNELVNKLNEAAGRTDAAYEATKNQPYATFTAARNAIAAERALLNDPATQALVTTETTSQLPLIAGDRAAKMDQYTADLDQREAQQRLREFTNEFNRFKGESTIAEAAYDATASFPAGKPEETRWDTNVQMGEYAAALTAEEGFLRSPTNATVLDRPENAQLKKDVADRMQEIRKEQEQMQLRTEVTNLRNGIEQKEGNERELSNRYDVANQRARDLKNNPDPSVVPQRDAAERDAASIGTQLDAVRRDIAADRARLQAAVTRLNALPA